MGPRGRNFGIRGTLASSEAALFGPLLALGYTVVIPDVGMSPCDVFGPACHLLDNATPSRPVMSNPLRSTMVVPMWNPVAKTIQSRSYSALAVTIPRSEIVVMALWALTSTRDTLGRLKAGR